MRMDSKFRSEEAALATRCRDRIVSKLTFPTWSAIPSKVSTLNRALHDQSEIHLVRGRFPARGRKQPEHENYVRSVEERTTNMYGPNSMFTPTYNSPPWPTKGIQ